ncbi:Cell surface A33 antigen [Pteropus alecto]|uniref:Cell surface A33 antigen n=1 Tax=Pteropus alecto TaxID=9402 RepID=L5KXX6_PTEAL|nr:Cell surface A33 antigen [Pteropus alecto]
MEASDLLAREKKLRRDSSQGEPTGGDGKFRAAAKTPNRDLCKEVETEAGKALETSRISPLASFLITVWAAVNAISVETPKEVLRAARGKSVTLPCTYSTSSPNRDGFIRWDKLLMSHTEKVLIWTFSTQSYIYGDLYKNRVNVSSSAEQSDASVTIGQLTMADNGTYECSVSLMADLDGTSKSRVHLLVLVPPAKPDCGIEGETVIGNDIQLTCQSKEGSPAPQYSWKSYSLLNQERAGSPVTGQSWTLKNISADTSGYYICTSSNEVGAESCNITVAVRPRAAGAGRDVCGTAGVGALPTALAPEPGLDRVESGIRPGPGRCSRCVPTASMNVALYAGIAGGSLAALILIGVLIYCCCCREKDEAKDTRP